MSVQISESTISIPAVYIRGTTFMGGEVTFESGKTITDVFLQLSALSEKIEQLTMDINTRLSTLEERMEMLWMAPNMPGAIEAEQDFNNQIKSLSMN